MYNNDNSLEKFPGSSPETKAERSVPPEQDFAEKMKDVPPFQPEKMFGTANTENQFYGESNTEEQETTERNEGLSDAAAIINYGLDAVARQVGVEATVQGIKSFDVSNSDNPVRDLYVHLGINTVEELKDTRDESDASKYARESFRNEYNMPKTQQKSREGAVKAIQDMKELIAEVEDADPRYQELRNNARAAGKGYFEYAVKDFGLRGLTDLFGVLAEQRKEKEQGESKQEGSEQEELGQKEVEQDKSEQEDTEQEDAEQEDAEQEETVQEESEQEKLEQEELEQDTPNLETVEQDKPEPEMPIQEVYKRESPEQAETEPEIIPINNQENQEKDPRTISGQ